MRTTASAPRQTLPTRLAEPLAIERVVLGSEVADPWLLLGSQNAKSPRFAWHDGQRGLSFIASGVLASYRATSSSQFESACAWYRQVRVQAGPEGMIAGAQLPLAVGGFAFANSRLGTDSNWHAWPRGLLVIPEFIAYAYESGERGLIVHRLRGGTFKGMSSAPSSHASQTAPTCPHDWDEQPAQATYEASVQAIVNDIAKGRISKVVVARRERLSASPTAAFDGCATARALRQAHPSALCFMVAHGEEHFVGASPETLAAVDDGELTTHGLAGTSAHGDAETLLASAKDRHEQALVVQDIVSALQPLCGLVETAATPRVVNAGHLKHLATQVMARLPAGASVLDAVAKLHPTAALCGTPRASAARWLSQNEGFDRGWYGGPVGWIAPNGDGVFAVAIRSALLKASETIAFAGAGVVAGSRPNAEWQETAAKLLSVKSALRAHSEGAPQ